MPSNVQLVSESILTWSSRPCRLVVAQALGDGRQRDRAVHRVLVQRVGVQVGDPRTAEHQRVVVGLVAVPIDEDHVAGADDRLHDDLVGRRGPVGDEEGLARHRTRARPAPAPA